MFLTAFLRTGAGMGYQSAVSLTRAVASLQDNYRGMGVSADTGDRNSSSGKVMLYGLCCENSSPKTLFRERYKE